MNAKILLCDDEPHIMRICQCKLQKAGMAVALTNDGEEAWDALQQELPDLLISDFQMARLDGISLARRIYQEPTMRHLPIILLTGKGLELKYDQCVQETGIRKVLSKPFSPKNLLSVVEEILSSLIVESNGESVV